MDSPLAPRELVLTAAAGAWMSGNIHIAMRIYAAVRGMKYEVKYLYTSYSTGFVTRSQRC